jgi:hypothetical protein
VIFVGIALACVTLAFEYWWMKYKKPNEEIPDAKSNKLFEQRQKWIDQPSNEKVYKSTEALAKRENVPYR